MELKESIQYATAVALVVSGVCMSIAGFIAAPLGEISDSVLNYLSQCLIWAGSIFSIKIYVNSQLNTLKKQLNEVSHERNK